MTEIRRVKMKFGDAEFEADVPEDRIQPMYDRFIFTLEQRSRTPHRRFNAGRRASADASAPIANPFVNSAGDTEAKLCVAPGESADIRLLRRLFDLRHDGVVTLKALPSGAERRAEALLLILYGYRWLKNEEGVLATQLHRAAEHSGISIRCAAYELAPYERFVNRVGQRKGSAYSLNDEGLAMAQELSSTMLAATLIENQAGGSALRAAAASTVGPAAAGAR
jgi:hypothetical protein